MTKAKKSEGLLASKKLNIGLALSKLNLGYKLDEKQMKEITEALQLGYNQYVKIDVQSKIRLGKAYKIIKDIAGKKNYKKVIEKTWLPIGKLKTFDDIKRTLQQASQLYEFYNRTGVRLTTELPVDSALKICSHIKSLPKKKQNSELKKINKTKEFEGVSISNTEQIRKATKNAKQKYEANPNYQEDVCFEKWRNLHYSLKQCLKQYSPLIKEAVDVVKKTFKKGDTNLDEKLVKHIIEVHSILVFESEDAMERLKRLNFIMKRHSISNPNTIDDHREVYKKTKKKKPKSSGKKKKNDD